MSLSEVRPPPVVDAHTHAYTPEVVRGRASYVGRDLWFEHLYADPRALLITGDDLLYSMDAAGIARSIVCGFPWHDIGICREHNDYLASLAASSNRRLSWLATVPLGGGKAAAQEAERCFALGASGLGELNADAQRFDLTAPGPLAPVTRVCVDHGRPLMLHSTEPVGHHYPGKGTATPDRLVSFIQAHPDLSVVLAHWGGGLPFYELMPEVAMLASRVTYDTAASTYLYRPAVFRAVLDILGPDRVMWGSDYPVLRQDRFLRRSQALPLTADEILPLFGGTAQRVYGLADSVPAESR